MEKTGSENLINIVVTGPESTGKTTLCENLAKHYHTAFIPEFARDYVSNLKRHYTYNDVIFIAKKQIELEEEYQKRANTILFYDTYLIITKVWLEVVYYKYPAWIDKQLQKKTIDYFLLCYPDIEWIPDQVRENGGKMREVLFKKYENEIKKINGEYFIIKGEERLNSSINYINTCLQNRTKNLN